jgi:hypothetical protein
MIERIVLVKLTDKAAKNRQAIVDYSLAVLNRIPGVADVHIGQAADHASAAAWDLALVLRFESANDLDPYRLHPDHRAYVDNYLKPRMESIKAWNFEI